MTAQALLGQTYSSHADLWTGLDERRDVLNRHLPSRVLSHKPPLEAYPQAMHSGRMYRPEWEEDVLYLENVWTYLRACRWFRRIRTNGFFCLGGSSYYLGKHVAQRSVALHFDPDPPAFVCQLEGSDELVRVPALGLTKADLMGELAAMQTLPTYQLALPFSLEAWRQLEYANGLVGTTLCDFGANGWVRLYETRQYPVAQPFRPGAAESLGHCCLDVSDRGPLPALAQRYPADHRPALLSSQV